MTVHQYYQQEQRISYCNIEQHKTNFAHSIGAIFFTTTIPTMGCEYGAHAASKMYATRCEKYVASTRE